LHVFRPFSLPYRVFCVRNYIYPVIQ
jgi:hypothetical protein